MKANIKALYNDIPKNVFEFTASVSSKDFFKLQDLFAMPISNGVDIEFKPIDYQCNCSWDNWFSMLRKCCEPKYQVIFNEPATILYKDDNKYVCKCDKEDTFNEELGLALCLLKSFGVSYSDFRELLDNAKRQGGKNAEKEKP